MADRQPQSAVEALVQALVARLKDDGRVKALVGARVFDEVPGDDNPRTPYIYVGPATGRRIEMGSCGRSRETRVRIFAVSTKFGRADVWAVIDAIFRALDNADDLVLAAPYSTSGDSLRFIQDGDVFEPPTPKSAFIDFTTTLTIGD